MNKTKKQHYVPRGYLVNFRSNKNSNNQAQIFVFDKVNKKSFCASINDVASNQYFYDLPDKYIQDFLNEHPEIKNKQIFENAFSEIEGKCLPIFKDIINNLEKIKINAKTTFNEKDIIKDEDKQYLSYFIALQYLRTKEQREILSELTKLYSEAETVAEKRNSDSYLPSEVEDNEDNKKLLHIETIFDISPEMADYIYQQTWRIGINMSDLELCTSDNPLILIPKHIIKGRGHGYDSYGMTFNLPISDKYMIIIYENNYFNEKIIKKDKYFELRDEDIKFLNILQLKKCYSQIFSKKDNFKWANNFCKKNPKYCDVNRKILKVYKSSPFLYAREED